MWNIRTQCCTISSPCKFLCRLREEGRERKDQSEIQTDITYSSQSLSKQQLKLQVPMKLMVHFRVNIWNLMLQGTISSTNFDAHFGILHKKNYGCKRQNDQILEMCIKWAQIRQIIIFIWKKPLHKLQLKHIYRINPLMRNKTSQVMTVTFTASER